MSQRRSQHSTLERALRGAQGAMKQLRPDYFWAACGRNSALLSGGAPWAAWGGAQPWQLSHAPGPQRPRAVAAEQPASAPHLTCWERLMYSRVAPLLVTHRLVGRGLQPPSARWGGGPPISPTTPPVLKACHSCHRFRNKRPHGPPRRSTPRVRFSCRMSANASAGGNSQGAKGSCTCDVHTRRHGAAVHTPCLHSMPS